LSGAADMPQYQTNESWASSLVEETLASTPDRT
jgi:hypothetical protein